MKTATASHKIEGYAEDTIWLFKNIKKLRKAYPNKFVAVKSQRVIDSDVEFEELLQKLKMKKENPAKIVIEYIPEKEVAMIL